MTEETGPHQQPDGDGDGSISRGSKFLFALVAVLIVFAVWATFTSGNRDELTYTQFRSAVNEGKIASAVFRPDSLEVTGEYNNPQNKGENTFEGYTVTLPNQNTSDRIIQSLEEQGVKIDTEEPGFLSGLFSPQILLLLLILVGPMILIFWLFNRQMQGGGQSQAFNFGKSKAELFEGESEVDFDDVAGVEESKAELEEVVDFLKNPKKYTAIGAEIPKGILLVGPPGCGKTLLARAVAGEAGVPFFFISGSDFVEMFVGVGASRVRDMFEQAKKRKPCLIFVDELDAVGRKRGAGVGGGHDEREQTLNQLLVELDGFEPNSGIILLAATNRPDVLDPALLRPGRFDRQVTVPRPDIRGRKEIFLIHLREKPISSDVDIKVLAQRTPGFTGADIMNACNEAALLAARQNKSVITMDDFDEAIDKVMAGPERKSRVISDKEKKIIAYHELGHAITAWALENADPVHKISILPRGQAQGYTLILPEEERYFASREEMMDKISSLLGGRVAEELIFESVTTGASNDLERATEIARDMVTVYGMSEHLGPIQFGKKNDQPFLGEEISESRNYSEQIAYSIDQEVKKIISTSYEKTREILEKHEQQLHYLSQVIMDKEHLDRKEFEKLMDEFDPENPPEYTPAIEAGDESEPEGSESEQDEEQQEEEAPGDEDLLTGPAPA